MILVDSSVWIDYFNGNQTAQTDWLDGALGDQIIVVGDIILTEVLQGFQHDSDYKKAKELLLEFPVAEMVGREIALKSAQNYRILRKRGVAVRKIVDIIIGTFCLHHGLALLHDDSDFLLLEKYIKLKTVRI